MWKRYRNWKHALVWPLALFCLMLMRGEPEESIRWAAGMGLAVLLGIVYLAEEIVWMARNQGRPCAQCGQKIPVRPFSLRIHCSHCGHRD